MSTDPLSSRTEHAVHETISTHSHTIARELVHRCAVSEVFVTSLARPYPRGDTDFVVGAQLPRMHAYYGDHLGAQAGHHDPLIVMEVARQASIALTHTYFDVPLDSAFLVRTFNGLAAPGSAWEIGRAPADLDIAVRVANRHVAAERLRGLDLILDIGLDGAHLMTVDGSFSWTTPKQWRALRSQARGGAEIGPITMPDPISAETVGRNDPRNVVIGSWDPAAGTPSAPLVVDIDHGGLFDHHLDHVPGSLLLEAARQVALTVSGAESGVPAGRITAVHSTFGQFVELDRPAVCVARRVTSADGVTTVLVSIEQDGRRCADIHVAVTPDAARDR
ncbi:ScbA/BarX family gamma-butyrolactone biosynthesis protein [Gordonia sp. VNQ95]|jgi:hypothetical protein|uniref:ScbA/BarX family gamma-butyrolactone biosynthesis protein n=1 Tax=Gordonia TaxID=2053 RepID=UPI0032B4B9E6